jgi:hypothetical protein
MNRRPVMPAPHKRSIVRGRLVDHEVMVGGAPGMFIAALDSLSA